MGNIKIKFPYFKKKNKLFFIQHKVFKQFAFRIKRMGSVQNNVGNYIGTHKNYIWFIYKITLS
ncbi:MAG: hypothetical protein COA57_07350 [Flavobacteriales bacterium]|nr:MAG: hypothetical protein COA57_07350 [Flavobacteriales bacterium]